MGSHYYFHKHWKGNASEILCVVRLSLKTGQNVGGIFLKKKSIFDSLKEARHMFLAILGHQ